MSGTVAVRLPSKAESYDSCVLCARHPARVLSYAEYKWRSVTLLCAMHFEVLATRIGDCPLTYEERKAHGLIIQRTEVVRIDGLEDDDE